MARLGEIRWLWVVVAVLALVGAGFVLLSTQSGVGVTADSIVYFNAAEFLLEGLELIQDKYDVMIYAGPGMGDTFLP